MLGFDVSEDVAIAGRALLTQRERRRWGDVAGHVDCADAARTGRGRLAGPTSALGVDGADERRGQRGGGVRCGDRYRAVQNRSSDGDQQLHGGAALRASAQFRVGRTLTDPTSVTATHKDPNGVLTSLSVTNDGTGLRHADVTPATKGRHVVRWVGTGACVAACETQFNAESEVV